MTDRLVPPTDPHIGVHSWTMICGPVRGDFSWCEGRLDPEPEYDPPKIECCDSAIATGGAHHAPDCDAA